jgi:hypothetical protein
MSGFIENFNNFVDGILMDTLGDDVVFTPSVGAGVAIKGIFNNAYYEAADGTGYGVGSSSPAVQCRDADVLNAAGGQIAYGGITYNIVSVKPDGTGITLLILRHA